MSPPGAIAVGAMVGAFGLVRLGEHQGWLAGWARGYLDDLLFVPLVLAAALVAHRRAGAGPSWTLPRIHGLLAVGFTGLVFEWGLPRYLARGIADPRDLLAYLAGWGLFALFVNRPAASPDPARRAPPGTGAPCPVSPGPPGRGPRPRP